MKTFPRKRGKLLALGLFWFLAACILAATAVPSVSAVSVLSDSDVYSILCDGVSAPDVQVVSPVSDSVVNNPNISLNGTTNRTTQIEVHVNNTYSQSLSVNPDGPFNTTVSLQEGTNTIRLEAYFSCNHTTANFSVVVTYEPQVTPSPGTDTDTNVPGGGVVIPPTISNPYAVIPADEPVDKPSFVERISEKLTFGGAPGETKDIYEAVIEPITSWLAVGALIVSVVALVSPALLFAAGAKVFGVAATHVHTHPHRHIHVRVFGLISTGVLVAILQL